MLPNILARAEVTPERAIKPVFDLVWQATRFPGSRNYHATGVWAPVGR